MTEAHLLAEATEVVEAMFGRPATPADGLQAAADFLDGLIKHVGLDGYMDPDAGEVSTLLVLWIVRASQAALAEAAS